MVQAQFMEAFSNFKNGMDKITDPGLHTTSHRTLKLGSHMPYRPTADLVSLFAKTGMRCNVARAPFFHNPSNNHASYAAVLKAAMDGGGAHRGNGDNSGRGHAYDGQAAVLGVLMVAMVGPGQGNLAKQAGYRRQFIELLIQDVVALFIAEGGDQIILFKASDQMVDTKFIQGVVRGSGILRS